MVKKMNKTVKVLIMAAVLAMAAVAVCSVAGTDESQAETVTKTVDGMTFDLTSDGSSNTAKLTAVDGSVTELIVPETVSDDSGKEYTVTSVGAIGGTSTNHTALVSAEFPETVVSADSNLFRSCTALTKAVLPGITEIPDYAFQGCNALTEVSFSDKVKSIGEFAFAQANRLADLTISCAPEVTLGNNAFYNSGSAGSELHLLNGTVTGIGGNVFYNSRFAVVDVDFDVDSIGGFSYSKVEKLVIGGHVESIGYQAFFGCTSLTSLTICGKPTYLGERFIDNCTSLVELDADFSAVENADSRTDGFSALTKLETPLIIGSTLYRFPCVENYDIPDTVAVIAGSACSDNSKVEEVTIPASVETVGYRAFYNCPSLKSVEFLGKSVTFLAMYSMMTPYSYAFGNCRSLESAVLPSEQTTIPAGLFQNCPNLVIEIPDGVKEIGRGAYQKSLGGTKELVIPSSVISVDVDAFNAGNANSSSLESITFKSGSEVSIGNNAFRYNGKVTNVVMPTKVASCGTYAFNGINAVITAEGDAGKYLVNFPAAASADSIPSDVVAIGSSAMAGWEGTEITIPSGVTSIESYAFSGCTKLKTAVIPSSVTQIGTYAFSRCSALAELTMSEGLTSIGSYAFANCTSLVSVTIPASVETMGYYVFKSCSGLQKAEFLGTDVTFGRQTSTVVSTQVTTYTSAVFSGCKNLTQVVLPSDMGRMPELFFYNCTSLSEITIPSTVTSIGRAAFQGCSSLSSIILPEGLTSIEDNAFYNCKALESIEFPDSLETIGASAFYCATAKMTALTIPGSVTDIGNNAFFGTGSPSLKSIVFGSGSNAKIGDNAFSGNVNVTDITISKVASLGTKAFFNTSAVVSVSIGEDTSKTLVWVYSDAAADMIPTDIVKIYDYALSGWKGTEIAVPSGVTSVGNYAFQNCTALKSASLPAGLISLGDYAFQGCSVLESVTFSDGLKTVGNYAFQNCKALTSVELPAGTETVGQRAFQNCSALGSVTFSDGLKTIGNYAFSGCTILNNVTFPDTLDRLGAFAFEKCTSLEAICIPESVTSLENKAFAGCTSLKNAVIECSYYNRYSPDYFADCTALETVKIYGSFNLCSVSTLKSLKEIEVFRGTFSVTDLSDGSILKVHENALIYSIGASQGIILEDDVGRYVKVTFVKGDGSASEGRVYLSLSSGSVVLPADCIGVVTEAVRDAVTAGTVIAVSGENTYLTYSDGMFYVGTSLAFVAPTSEAITVREGTQHIGFRAATSGFNVVDGKCAPYLVLPSTLKVLEESAIYSYDDETSVILKTDTSLGSSNLPLYRYYQVGTTLPDDDMKVAGYWTYSNGKYTLFKINDFVHANLSGVTYESGSVKFSVTLDPAYVLSEITVKVGDDVIVPAGGVYTVEEGSKVTITGVEESLFTVKVSAPEGVKTILSDTCVLYNTEVTLECRPLSDSYGVSGIKVMIDAAEVSAGEDGKYRFTVTEDLTVTVTATVVPANVTVTYSTGGGSAVSDSVFVKGEAFVFPSTVPTKDSSLFYSWYLDEGFTKPAAGTVLTENITVYAKWTAVSDGLCTVTLSVASGSDGKLTAYRDGCVVNSGEKVTKGTILDIVYDGGINHEVNAWYVGGVLTVNPRDSMEVTVNDDISVEVTADYYFGDISNMISESEGIKSGDKYTTAWTLPSTKGYAIVGDYAYIPLSTGYFTKVDLYTGEIVKKYQTDSLSGKAWPAVGNGMVLDPGSGIVFDLDLNPLYVLGTKGQNAFYDDGYWYINPASSLYCYSAVDENSSDSLNVQTQIWKASEFHGYIDAYTLPTTLGFGKNYVIYVGVGADDASARYIYTISKDTGVQVDSYQMTELYRSTWNYGYIYCSEGMITVKCQYTTLFDGSFSDGEVLYRAYVDDNGNIERGTGAAIKLNDLVGYGSSAVIYNGLGYVYTSGYFFVLDLDDMRILASAKCGTGDQSRTNLTLTVGEDGIVRGYNNPYTPKTNEVTRCFEYNVATNVLKTYTLTPTVAMQYADADFIKFGSGGIYLMRNDSGITSCVSKAVTVTIIYSDGTKEVRAVACGAPLGTDARVEKYCTDDAYLTPYDSTQRITGDLTVYAMLKTWYVEDGTLTVTKDFAMEDYSKSARAPWADEDFTAVEIEEGITSVGAYAFYGCIDLTSVSLPSTIEEIGDYAFYGCASLGEVTGSSDPITIGKSAFDKSGLTFSILYKVDGGKYAKIDYAYGSKISAPESPSKEGYTFVEWVDLPKTMPMEDLIIKAEFEINSYTVTVNYVYADGTEASESVSVKDVYGKKYSFDTGSLTGYTADKTVVSGTIGAKDETITVTYTINSYDVAVKYVFADGSRADRTETVPVEYGKVYSVETPAVTGYTADKTVVSGTMGTEAVSETVTYTINSYDVAVKYVFADGSRADRTETVPVEYGKVYSVETPAVTGYTADKTVVSGTMGTEAVSETVTYTINSYDVAVKYVFADGSRADRTETVPVEYGKVYSVETPAVTGYTADKTVVSGTMGTEAVSETVTYTANTYVYTVSYKDAGGKVLREQYEGVAVYGTSVSPAIPKIVGYTGPASTKTIKISDVVSDNALEYEYTINSYNVSVKYVFADGTKAAETETVSVEYGEPYSVNSPAVTGHTADTATVSGTVYLEDISVTVRYTANTYAYTVSYVDTGGKVLKTQYEGTAAYGTSVTPAVVEIAGYTGPADTKTIQISDAVSKNAVEYIYAVKTYNVTVVFDSNGGSSVGAKTVVSGTAVADPGAPEFAEHVFAGWYLGDAEYDFASAVTDSIVLTAKWNVREYTVTFDGAAQKVASGSAATAPAAPSRSADAEYTYTFAYWALDGREYDISSAVYSDLRIVSVFNAIATASSGNASEVDATKTENKVSVPEGITTETFVFDTGNNTKVSVDSDGVKGKTVEVSLDPVKNDTAVEGTAYEFVFSVDGSAYGKSIEVTLPYSDAPGKIPAVYYCSGGLSAQMKTVSFGDGSITFTTDHNSTYVVAMVDENSADGTEDGSDSTMMIVAAVAAVLIIGAAIVGFYHLRNNRKNL